MTNPRRRLPLKPLLVQAGGWGRLTVAMGWEGFSHRKLQRMRLGHGITLDEADTLACAIGLHPLDVWGDAWLEGDDLEDEWGDPFRCELVLEQNAVVRRSDIAAGWRERAAA